MKNHHPKPPPYGPQKFGTIDEYHAVFAHGTQRMLEQLRTAIKQAAPQATETISYNMPTFKQNKNLVHYSAYKNHIGFYPTATALLEFKNQLLDYKTSKGAIQFPIDKPLPLALVKKIVKYRVQADQRQEANLVSKNYNLSMI